MKLCLAVIGLCLVSNLECYCCNGKKEKQEEQVPCFFIFGDSLADNGNNNQLSTKAKVNYSPYGIDYVKGPTGRFCNGRTTVDILAELLGFREHIPSFVTANRTKNIQKGVNYASGASGIQDETGRHLGDNVNFDQQLKNHQITVSRLAKKYGNSKAKKYLNKCLYWVGMGHNDYLNNYFMPKLYSSRSRYNSREYARLLTDRYHDQIEKLQKFGARKVALMGLGKIGCLPNSISLYETQGSLCVDYMNDAVQHFNDKLVSLIDKLNSKLTNAKFIYINSSSLGSGDPTTAGFKKWDTGCCHTNELGQCDPKEPPCEYRNEYVYWDAFHPTEAANLISASRVYSAFTDFDTYPMDINHLIKLSLSSNKPSKSSQ
ncbi:hypothetical protein UlMin_042744 [Ulmus minor]